jgi:hypothetical protein
LFFGEMGMDEAYFGGNVRCRKSATSVAYQERKTANALKKTTSQFEAAFYL